MLDWLSWVRCWFATHGKTDLIAEN